MMLRESMKDGIERGGWWMSMMIVIEPEMEVETSPAFLVLSPPCLPRGCHPVVNMNIQMNANRYLISLLII
jgi:hypothetical protein